MASTLPYQDRKHFLKLTKHPSLLSITECIAMSFDCGAKAMLKLVEFWQGQPFGASELTKRHTKMAISHAKISAKGPVS